MAHILVVDDSPTDVHLAKSALEGAGHQVSVGTSPEEGVAMAKTLQPALVLMDIVFQGTSGYQAVRALAKDPETATMPVMIVSVKGLDSDKAWGMRQGAVEYVVKPFKPRELVEAVNKVLAAHGST